MILHANPPILCIFQYIKIGEFVKSQLAADQGYACGFDWWFDSRSDNAY